MSNKFHLEGVDAFNNQEYAKAKTLFLQAIAIDPAETESYLYLGKSCFFCDEKQGAITHLKKYIELNQNNAEAVANVSYAFDLMGQCYEANNQGNEAMSCYTTATKINPSAASAWHNLGLFYIKSAQHYLEQDLANSFKLFQGARAYLIKALNICSTNPLFLHSVACWYEKYIDALEKVTEAEEAVQQNIDSNYRFAVEYYQKALEACYPADTGLKNIITANLTECLAQYGHFLYKAQDFEKALGIYLQAIHLDPEHSVVMNQIGMSHFKLNHFPEARHSFTAILSLASNNAQELADAWLNIACTHRMEKSWEAAENALNQARQFVPHDPDIDAEEEKLIALKAQASLIGASQGMFSYSSVDQQPPIIEADQLQLQ